MAPGERHSLLHRFVLDHADSRLVNLAAPGYVPEYALVISKLEPERVFAAHGPEGDPFKPYKEAWPDYAGILPDLHKQVFVVSRRFLAVYQADSLLPATLWWNDHFPSNTAVCKENGSRSCAGCHRAQSGRPKATTVNATTPISACHKRHHPAMLKPGVTVLGFVKLMTCFRRKNHAHQNSPKIS